MPSTNPLRQAGRQVYTNAFGACKGQWRPMIRQARGNLENGFFPRHASTAANPAAQYHIPKRTVHIGVPLVAAIYAVILLTDPSMAPQPPRMMEAVQDNCNKVHASDLNNFIKSHPDELSDDHTVGWNQMYESFKKHRKSQSEPARIEEENAKQLAQYARIEDNKYRSTKVPGIMATEGGNRNITHRPEMVTETEAGQSQTLSERIAARVAEAKRRFTKATKGRDFS